MRKFSLIEKVLTGIGTIVIGILLYFGQVIGERILTGSNAPFVSSLGTISFWSLLSSVVIIVGIAVCIYAILALRKAEKKELTTSHKEAASIEKEKVHVVEQSYSPKQFRYRGEVRADLVRIYSELYQIIVRKQILFKSWNESTEHDFHNLKHQLIKIKEQDEAIEHFSTALSNRNDGLRTPKFGELNDKCIALYAEIRETGFLDVDVLQEEGIPVSPQVMLHRLGWRFWVRSTADWFEIGFENGKLIDVTGRNMRRGKIDEVTLHENYFHVKQETSSTISAIIEATFDSPRDNIICVLRKSDKGRLIVSAKSVSPIRIGGGWRYERSPKEKNELTFNLKQYDRLRWFLSF